MKETEDIIKGHKLDEYHKKYFRCEKTLLRIEQNKVEEFDNKYAAIRLSLKDKYLLKDRKWWLIDKTYYEVPKVMSWNWFKSFSLGFKALFVLLAGGLAAGVSVTPIYVINYLNEKNSSEQKKILNPSIVIDSEKSFDKIVDEYTKKIVSSGTIVESKIDNNHNAVYKVYLNSTAKATLYHISSFLNIKRGDVVFGESDYTITSESEEGYNYSHTITIKANSLKQSTGDVSIIPEYKQYDVFPIPPTTEDKLEFTLDSNVYTVKAKNNSIDGVISIPSSYSGKQVKYIANDGFAGCNKITEVYVPDSISSIGDNAFKDSSLSFINFKNGSDDFTIGDGCFTNNKNLWYISLPEKTKTISDYAFSNCENLSIINLCNIFNEGQTKNIPSLAENSFNNCSSLEVIYVWDNDMKTAFSTAENWRVFSEKIISVTL